MLRLIPCASFLMFCLWGCFSEPSGSGSGNGSSGGVATSTGDGTTDPTAPTSTGSETTAASGTTSSGSSSSGGTTADVSTAADESSSTGAPEGLCGCPQGAYEFCERFDEFEDGEFKAWGVPGGSEPPQQVLGLCGQAFRGEIGPDQDFAVITQRLLEVLANPATDVIRLRGLMHIEAGCADATPHRLLAARADTGKRDYLYSAELELNNGELLLVQRAPSPAPRVDDVIGKLLTDEWLPFEVSLLGLQSGDSPMVRARVGDDMAYVERIPLLIPMLSFSVVPGPFAYTDPSLAGCSVRFDNVSVELLPAED